MDFPSNFVESLIEEMPMCALRERPAFYATSEKVAKVQQPGCWSMHSGNALSLYNQVSTGQ